MTAWRAGLALLLAGSAVGCSKPAPRAVDVAISSDGDFLAFRPAEISVPAGARVTLTFHHAGAIITQAHDWALARPGAMPLRAKTASERRMS